MSLAEAVRCAQRDCAKTLHIASRSILGVQSILRSFTKSDRNGKGHNVGEFTSTKRNGLKMSRCVYKEADFPWQEFN